MRDPVRGEGQSARFEAQQTAEIDHRSRSFELCVELTQALERTGDFGQTVGRKGENRISAVQLPSDMLEHAGDSFCIALLLSKILD
jgi:hypothetical protein